MQTVFDFSSSSAFFSSSLAKRFTNANLLRQYRNLSRLAFIEPRYSAQWFYSS